MSSTALRLASISLPQARSVEVPLDRLEHTHGTTPRAARMYSRFFGQSKVLLHPAAHGRMLADALSSLLGATPTLRLARGLVIYAKTQTHNTPVDHSWLAEILVEAGLAQWEAATVSMTNCASALAALHLFKWDGRPIIVLAGEKAFHAFGSRLTIGLLGESPVAVLFAAEGRPLELTAVRHLPRFFRNPDDMDAADRRAFMPSFEEGFKAFVSSLAHSHPGFMARDPVIVPYNLNLPLLGRVLESCGMIDRVVAGHSGRCGHSYCSDPFLNLARLSVPEDRPVLLLSAGMGITFAALGLGPRISSPFQATET